MVSSGTVTADSSELASKLSTYTSTINDLSSGWKGASHDGITSKASDFASEYLSTIQGEMTSFAEAIDLYEKYKTAKNNAKISQENYNQALKNNDNSNASKFANEVSKYTQEYTKLKSQIEAALSAASATKLEATAITPDASTDTGGTNTSTDTAQKASGEFKNYYQGDYSQPYSQGTIATSGCGPTSMAMVITNLTGKEVSPVETAAKGNGKYTCEKGTTWNYFGDMAKQYGLKCNQMPISSDNIVSNLQKGNTLILSMGPGHFTKGGHFIVARGLDSNGKVIVSDPASRDRSAQTWDVSILSGEGKQIWAFST